MTTPPNAAKSASPFTRLAAHDRLCIGPCGIAVARFDRHSSQSDDRRGLRAIAPPPCCRDRNCREQRSAADAGLANRQGTGGQDRDWDARQWQSRAAAIHSIYVLLDATKGEVLAVMDGGELTARRTAAASALAAQFLGRTNVDRLLIVGAGRLRGTSHRHMHQFAPSG